MLLRGTLIRKGKLFIPFTHLLWPSESIVYSVFSVQGDQKVSICFVWSRSQILWSGSSWPACWKSQRTAQDNGKMISHHVKNGKIFMVGVCSDFLVSPPVLAHDAYQLHTTLSAWTSHTSMNRATALSQFEQGWPAELAARLTCWIGCKVFPLHWDHLG